MSPDIDSDMIVDVPYALDGEADNEDPFPLADPDAVPPVTRGTGTESAQIPMEIIMVAGGVVIIILVGVFVLKRRT